MVQAFTYGWETNGDPSTPFWVRFNPVAHEPMAWKEEMYAAARQVANDAGTKPIWVCSSGGIDSEVLCRALFDQGIHFKVLSIQHTAGTNAYDTWYAIEWCRSHNVDQKLVQLDMPRFLNEEIDSYVRQSYVTSNVYRYFQIRLMEIVEEMGGYAVIAGGEQLYKTDVRASEISAEDLYLEYDVGIATPLEWCRRNNISHQPFFFYSTPEVALAYLKVPFVDFAVKHPDIFRVPENAKLLKRMVYQSVWTDMKSRPKLNGYERIQDTRDKVQNLLKASFGPLLQTYRLQVVTFRSQLEYLS